MTTAPAPLITTTRGDKSVAEKPQQKKSHCKNITKATTTATTTTTTTTTKPLKRDYAKYKKYPQQELEKPSSSVTKKSINISTKSANKIRKTFTNFKFADQQHKHCSHINNFAAEESNSDSESGGSNSNDSSTIFSLSSTLSSSLDHDEAELHAHEADAEDESEEATTTTNKMPHANDNLVQVQNFLKSFGEQRTSAVVTSAEGNRLSLANFNKPISTIPPNNSDNNVQRIVYNQLGNEMTPSLNLSSTSASADTTSTLGTTSSELRNYRSQFQHKMSSAPSTVELSSTSSITPTTKHAKFKISTKFLRKPRNKLKTFNILSPPTNSSSNIDVGNMNMLLVHSKQLENLPQQQPPPFQIFNEDANIKFKDFSIDSLLNK